MRDNDIIVKTVARLMVPFLLLFGVYVLLHGHVGAGGGFQAGVIITSALILAAISKDINEIGSKVGKRTLLLITAVGSLTITIIGFLTIYAGGSFSNLVRLPLPFPSDTIHVIAITLVEIGIGVAVFGTMFFVFLVMAGDSS